MYSCLFLTGVDVGPSTSNRKYMKDALGPFEALDDASALGPLFSSSDRLLHELAFYSV